MSSPPTSPSSDDPAQTSSSPIDAPDPMHGSSKPAIFVLPSELIDDIVALFDKDSLHSFCLACRAFTPFCRRYIFRSLKWNAPGPMVQLCLLLVRKPHLAMLVRGLSIEPQVQISSVPRNKILFSSGKRLVSHPLALMFGLQQLTVKSTSKEVTDILAASPFLLDSLSFRALGEHVELVFYERQHLVRELTLTWVDATGPEGRRAYCDTLRLRPLRIFPRLSKLTTDDIEITKAFMPNRPVTHLHIACRPFTLNLSTLKDALRSFSLSTGPLECLTLTLDSINSDLIEAICIHLRDLTRLSFWMTSRAPENAEVMRSFTAYRTVTAFKRLRYLKELEIMLTRIVDIVVDDEYQKLMDPLEQACPTLHVVQFGDSKTITTYRRTDATNGSSSFSPTSYARYPPK